MKRTSANNNYGSANERLRTSFANSGRIAGMGIVYDNYGEESGCPNYEEIKRNSCTRPFGSVTFPSDYLSEEEKKALNGEVRVYKTSFYER